MSQTPPVPKPPIAADPAPPATTDDRARARIAGAAVGIGSAAIVAALLYVNRKPAKNPARDRTDRF